MSTNSDDNRQRLESKLDKIEEKIDRVIDHVSSIDITLAKQGQSLDYHIKRTDLLQELVTPAVKLEQDFQGIKKTAKLVVVIGGIVGSVAKFLHHFFSH